MKTKQPVIFVFLLSLLASIFIGCQPQFQAGTYTDDVGREVSINEIPERIVSHVPGITEILFALGLEEKVVGVSEYCDYPEEARLKNKVGGFFDPSIEMIVALNPDLVLTNGSQEQLMIQLDELGITYIVLKPEDIDGILKDIELVGEVTATGEKAKEVVKDMQDRMSRISAQVRDAPRVRAFYTFATTDFNNPWTAGPGSFVDSLITIAGGENIAARLQAPYAQFSIEEVVASDPEIIILDASHGSAVTPIEELRQHPVWREIAGIKQNRVYPIDGDLVNRPGPRLVQGLEEIAKMIHPELFD